MFSLPTPPTDNLYKFIAIAGLVLAGFGIVTPFIIARQAIDLSVKRKLETEDRMREIIFRITETAQKDQLATKEERKAQIENIGQDIKTIHDQFETDLETEAQRYRDATDTQVNYLLGCIVVGLLIAGGGFWLWYKRVQQPLDEKMTLELVAARADSGAVQGSMTNQPRKQNRR
jgi:hypothetical protein